jgi:RNA polymerase subunit RPABC4/transcription elongation factor Spt4
MHCPRCDNTDLALIVIRNFESDDRRVFTYLCEKCLMFVNEHHSPNDESFKEEWGSMQHG